MRAARAYCWRMADWYLSEWLAYFGKKQADVVRELDWNKAKVSLTASGKQPYFRDDVKEITEWLGLRPYELLMHPRDALAIRNMRESAEQIVHPAEPQDEFVEIGVKPVAKPSEIRRRTGTHG